MAMTTVIATPDGTEEEPPSGSTGDEDEAAAEAPFYYGEEASMAAFARDFLTSISFTGASASASALPPAEPSVTALSQQQQQTPPPPRIESPAAEECSSASVQSPQPLREAARSFLSTISLGATPATSPSPPQPSQQPQQPTEEAEATPPSLASQTNEAARLFLSSISLQPRTASSQQQQQQPTQAIAIGGRQQQHHQQQHTPFVSPNARFPASSAAALRASASAVVLRHSPGRVAIVAGRPQLLLTRPAVVARGTSGVERFVAQDAALQRRCRLYFACPKSQQPLLVSSVKLDRAALAAAERGSALGQSTAGAHVHHGAGSLSPPLAFVDSTPLHSPTASGANSPTVPGTSVGSAMLLHAAGSSTSSVGTSGHATGPQTSYEHLLHPRWLRLEDGPASFEETLDGPMYKTGKHGTVLSLPGFRSSIVPFVRPHDLKGELNEQFRQHHRAIHEAGITLSRLRKAKRRVLAVIRNTGHETSSAAVCFCLLDRLLRTGKITRNSFNTAAATCVYLAVKSNELPSPGSLRHLREALGHAFDISPSAIVRAEFGVFTDLSFGLFLDPNEIAPYLEALGHEVAAAASEDES